MVSSTKRGHHHAQLKATPERVAVATIAIETPHAACRAAHRQAEMAVAPRRRRPYPEERTSTVSMERMTVVPGQDKISSTMPCNHAMTVAIRPGDVARSVSLLDARGVG